MVENGGRKSGRQGIYGLLCVVIPKRMHERLLDVKVWRGEGGEISGHFLVQTRLKSVGGWRRAGRMKGVRNVLKVSELNNSVKERAYISVELSWTICEQARDEMVKDVNGQILRDGVDVRRRWAEYFEQELKVAVVRKVNINVVSN